MPVVINKCNRCGYEWPTRQKCWKCGEENLTNPWTDTDGAQMMQCGTCGIIQRVSPKTCANKKCRSPYWNRERKQAKKGGE